MIMMKRIHAYGYALLLMLLAGASAMSQSTVSGKVTDSKTKKPSLAFR